MSNCVPNLKTLGLQTKEQTQGVKDAPYMLTEDPSPYRVKLNKEIYQDLYLYYFHRMVFCNHLIDWNISLSFVK